MKSFLSGKVMLGILVVAAATGGFTLGYFVGKGVSPQAVSTVVRAPANEVETPPPAPSSRHGAGNDSSSSVVSAAKAPHTENSRSEAPSPASQKTVTPSSPPQLSVRQGAGPAGETPAIPAKMPASVSGKDVPETTVKVHYTVQAGAFRNQKDAEALKRKLEAKGYKVSIKKESDAKGVVFFKVRTGDFEKKKEASVFALKLKKTDGLNAFAAEKK